MKKAIVSVACLVMTTVVLYGQKVTVDYDRAAPYGTASSRPGFRPLIFAYSFPSGSEYAFPS